MDAFAKIKVLHVISRFGGGGLERRAIQVVKGLCGQPGIEQSIFVYSDKVDYEEVLRLPVDIVYRKARNRKETCQEISHLIQTYRPDIVHSWLDRFPTEQFFFPWLKFRYGFKYIHGAVCDGLTIPRFTTVWFGQKLSFLAADAVVSNSKAGLLAKGAPLKKSHVIYNGFNFERIPQQLDKKKVEAFGVVSQYVVTMCGRVDGSKDWDSYLYVAQKAAESSLDVTFLAVGNGVLLDQYKTAVNEHRIKNVFFTGRRNDVEELVGLSDVCMLLTDGSRHVEGVSNFIVESMASGKPVIATRGGGTPEIITDGENGYVVEDNKQEAFERLKELLSDADRRTTFGYRAKEEVEHRFSIDVQTRSYFKLYHQLIEQ